VLSSWWGRSSVGCGEVAVWHYRVGDRSFRFGLPFRGTFAGQGGSLVLFRNRGEFLQHLFECRTSNRFTVNILVLQLGTNVYVTNLKK
jgi:hypothetical protein